MVYPRRLRICVAGLLKSGLARAGARKMSRGPARSGRTRRNVQVSISAKVSVKEKAEVRAECGRRGCSESELVVNAVFGRLQRSDLLLDNARAHLAAAHAVRAQASAGSVLDRHLVDELIAVTRTLIAELRGRT